MGMVGLAVSGSTVGIVLLYLVSLQCGTPVVSLDELEDHMGQRVIVEGAVVRAELEENGVGSVTLYDSGNLLKLNTEMTGRRDMELHRWIRAEGDLLSWGDTTRLQVTTDDAMKDLGPWEPLSTGLDQLSEAGGEYVKINGTVARVRSWEGGFTRLDVMDGHCACSVSVDGDISDDLAITVLETGDRVSLCGMVENGSWGNSLELLDARAVEKVGKWSVMELTPGLLALEMSRLAVDMELSTDRITDDCLFPINLTGYVRYEPLYPGSLVLTELPGDGDLSFKVILEDECQGAFGEDAIHMWDRVRITGMVRFDPDTLRYEISATSLDIREAHGPINVTLEELVANPSIYQGARVCVDILFVQSLKNDTWLAADPSGDSDAEVGIVWIGGAPFPPALYGVVSVTGEWVLDGRDMAYRLECSD